jgi:hypothetical protein
MENKLDIISYLAVAESDKIHRNKTERFHTSAYGIYYQYHQNASIFGFYKVLCREHRIPCDLSNKANRDRLNKVIHASEELKEKQAEHAEAFYRAMFLPDAVSENLNSEQQLAFFSMSVLMGTGRAIEMMQKQVGTKTDRIIGVKTIEAMKNFDTNLFLDVAQARLNRMIDYDEKKEIYRNGWKNRVDKLRPNKEEPKKKAQSKKKKD